MSLPKIDVPVFECYLHSLGKKVKFKSFTVKEEKILLVTKEDNDLRKTVEAIRQVMNNCLITKVDLDKLAFFDFEFLFLNIRSKSIGDVIPISIVDTEEGQSYNVSVNIDEVKLRENESHSKNIKLTDKVGLIMKYPSMLDVLDITNQDVSVDDDGAFEIIKKCIDSVYEGESVHSLADETKEEVDAFFNSLTSDQFNKLQQFFDTMPRLRHEIKYKNKSGEDRTYVLEDVSDFF